MKRTPLRPVSLKKLAEIAASGPKPRKPLPKKRKVQRRKEKCPSCATLDRLFSEYIRRHGECQLWGFGGIPCSTQMQCSHIISRRFHSTRWEPLNAVCACASHHRHQHDHPIMSGAFLMELLGMEHLRRLQEISRSGRRLSPDDKRELARFFRAEIAKAVAA